MLNVSILLKRFDDLFWDFKTREIQHLKALTPISTTHKDGMVISEF